jgi:hypothetical protein
LLAPPHRVKSFAYQPVLQGCPGTISRKTCRLQTAELWFKRCIPGWGQCNAARQEQRMTYCCHLYHQLGPRLHGFCLGVIQAITGLGRAAQMGRRGVVRDYPPATSANLLEVGVSQTGPCGASFRVGIMSPVRSNSWVPFHTLRVSETCPAASLCAD